MPKLFKVNEKELQFLEKKLARQRSIVSGTRPRRVTQRDSFASIGSISGPISSYDHSSNNQAIAMADTETTSENLIISFLENNKLQ